MMIYYLKILLFLSLFNIPLIFYSQNFICQTIDGESAIIQDSMTSVVGGSYTYIDNGSGSHQTTIRVVVQVIRRSDGTGGLNDGEIASVLNILSDRFADANICISVSSRATILSDVFFYMDLVSGPTFDNLVNVNAHNDAIDIYLLPDNQVAANKGKADGIPGLACVVGGAFAQSAGIAHEVGHCLGLYHTSFGYDSPAPQSSCEELVNGTNSGSCGDYVDDTPADPGLQVQGNMDVNCNYTGTSTDDNGDLFTPLTNNIMSLAGVVNSACLEEFTTGQFNRMQAYLDNNTLLQPVVVSDNITITSGVFNTVTLFAVNHVLQAEGNVQVVSGGDVIFTAGDKVFLKDGFKATGGKFRAFTSVFCSVLDGINSAKTGNEESVDNSDSEENTLPDIPNGAFLLYPNPTSGEFTLTVQSSMFNVQSFIYIYDILGELVYQSKIVNLKSKIVNISLHPKGIYLIKVIQNEKVYIKKLVHQ